MKTIFLTALAIVLAAHWCFAEENTNGTDLLLPSTRETFVEIVGRRLRTLWTNLSGEENKGTFIGRCFGVARKLKLVMPMIIFKLGVIMTILAFLTIFSLKSLSLLGLLVLFNVSGAIAKISAAISGKQKDWKPPQTVHFHVHQDKEGHYITDHSYPGWEDRLDSSESEETFRNSEYYNFYYKLLNKNPSIRSYRDISS